MNIYSNNIETIANLVYLKNNLIYDFLKNCDIEFKQLSTEDKFLEKDIVITNDFIYNFCSNFNNIEELLISLELPTFICDQEEIMDIINDLKQKYHI